MSTRYSGSPLQATIGLPGVRARCWDGDWPRIDRSWFDETGSAWAGWRSSCSGTLVDREARAAESACSCRGRDSACAGEKRSRMAGIAKTFASQADSG